MPSPGQNAAPTLADDLLWGVRAIADELGIDVRRAYYMLQRQHLPGIKCGTLWVASRSALRARFNGEPGRRS
jgi:hypothetical protein